MFLTQTPSPIEVFLAIFALFVTLMTIAIVIAFKYSKERQYDATLTAAACVVSTTIAVIVLTLALIFIPPFNSKPYSSQISAAYGVDTGDIYTIPHSGSHADDLIQISSRMENIDGFATEVKVFVSFDSETLWVDVYEQHSKDAKLVKIQPKAIDWEK